LKDDEIAAKWVQVSDEGKEERLEKLFIYICVVELVIYPVKNLIVKSYVHLLNEKIQEFW
jgi:hypothetical protein